MKGRVAAGAIRASCSCSVSPPLNVDGVLVCGACRAPFTLAASASEAGVVVITRGRITGSLPLGTEAWSYKHWLRTAAAMFAAGYAVDRDGTFGKNVSYRVPVAELERFRQQQRAQRKAAPVRVLAAKPKTDEDEVDAMLADAGLRLTSRRTA